MLHRFGFRRTLAAALLVAGGWFGAPAANALIPYVYLPTEAELKGSSIGIGRTAAQLLQLGQAKDAARLAALAVRLNPCLLYTSPSPRDYAASRMPSSA